MQSYCHARGMVSQRWDTVEWVLAGPRPISAACFDTGCALSFGRLRTPLSMLGWALTPASPRQAEGRVTRQDAGWRSSAIRGSGLW